MPKLSGRMNNPENAKLFIVTDVVALVVFAFLLIQNRYPGFGLPENIRVTTDFPVRWVRWGLFCTARSVMPKPRSCLRT